jgi:hypothetical protein
MTLWLTLSINRKRLLAMATPKRLLAAAASLVERIPSYVRAGGFGIAGFSDFDQLIGNRNAACIGRMRFSIVRGYFFTIASLCITPVIAIAYYIRIIPLFFWNERTRVDMALVAFDNDAACQYRTIRPNAVNRKVALDAPGAAPASNSPGYVGRGCVWPIVEGPIRIGPCVLRRSRGPERDTRLPIGVGIFPGYLAVVRRPWVIHGIGEV